MKFNKLFINRYVILVLLSALIYFWVTTPPCTVVHSDFLETSLQSLPDTGITIRSSKSLEKALAEYGIEDCPSWVLSAKFDADEQVVMYSGAKIIKTFEVHGSLVGVLIDKTDKHGVGVALLKGDLSPTPIFNAIRK